MKTVRYKFSNPRHVKIVSFLHPLHLKNNFCFISFSVIPVDHQQHVIIQLEYSKNRVPVQTRWIVDFDLIREKLKTSQKHQEPVFFFFYKDPKASPIFSQPSYYSKTFDPEKAVLLKGYVSNKIYGECPIFTNFNFR